VDNCCAGLALITSSTALLRALLDGSALAVDYDNDITVLLLVLTTAHLQHPKCFSIEVCMPAGVFICTES
jgi:hypothetical protein